MNSNVACPACLRTDVDSILTVSAAQAAQSVILPKSDPVRNERLTRHIQALWGMDHCQILKCQHCGFGFSWPFVAGDAEFYNLANSDIVYPEVKWEYHRTIEALRLRNGVNMTALEVGAGDGFFLDLVSPSLIKSENILAVEYNNKSIANLKQRGYRTTSADIRDPSFNDRQNAFDVIFMFQVVEHMDKVGDLFDRVRYLLKPNGSAFIAVPNPRRIEYQESHESVLDMPPNHIGRWTSEAFFELSKRAGLRLVASEIEPLDWVEFLKHDITYSHIRRTQLDPDGVSARIRSLPRSRYRRPAEALAAAMFIPSRFGSWLAAYSNRKNMGGSLWVQLETPEQSADFGRAPCCQSR
jgi:2-polyprenyl-3-methyl-5-hydroxy-6-metoxy-1,4-benzoquinol methylase